MGGLDAPGQRIVIVGPSCAGKSTLGEELGRRLRLPVVELDALHWLPGWQGRPDEEFHPMIEQATAGERWVVVGNYQRTRSITWPRAQTLLWLDFPLRVTVPRILRRSFRRYRKRELLWGSNRENFFEQLMLWDMHRSLIAYNVATGRQMRERYQSEMDDGRWPGLRLVRLRGPGDVQRWLRALE